MLSAIRRHLDVLFDSHIRLREWLKQIRQDCLTPSQILAFGGAELLSEKRQKVKSPYDSDGEEAGSADSLSTQCSGTDSPAVGSRTALLRRLWDLKSVGATPQAIAAHLAYDLNAVSGRITEAWHLALDTILQAPREITMRQRVTWERQIAKQWGASVVKDRIRDDVMSMDVAEAVGEGHEKHAESVRRAFIESSSAPKPAFEDLPLP